MVQLRNNADTVGASSDVEGCAMLVNGIGFEQVYIPITDITRG